MDILSYVTSKREPTQREEQEKRQRKAKGKKGIKKRKKGKGKNERIKKERKHGARITVHMYVYIDTRITTRRININEPLRT